MNQTEALIKTSTEALGAARALYRSGHGAPAVYYGCHAFEMAGNAFAAARGARVGQNHARNLNTFKTEYHRAQLQHSLDPVLERVRLLREPSRYPVRLEITDEGEEWAAPSDHITQQQADELLRRVNGALYEVILPNLWP